VQQLRLVLLFLLNRSLLDLLLESVLRNRVQSQHGLVRVLDEDILAIVHLEAHVSDGSDDTPAIVEVEGHLVSEVAGLVGEHAEDDVVVVVLGVGAGNETVIVSLWAHDGIGKCLPKLH
jgi:hypothetical protein